MSEVENLNDTCFVLSTELMVEVAKAFENEIGRRPTVKEFSEILFWGIKSSSFDLFSDAVCQLTESVNIKVKKSRKRSLVKGDLFAIPAHDDRYYLCVYLATNGRFGDAFGLFQGTHLPRPNMSVTDLQPYSRGVYLGTMAILEGTWIYLGNQPESAEMFDCNVPQYHPKQYHKHNERIGEFGAAGYIDGTLRQLDKEEAENAGLLDRTYRAGWLEDEIPALIAYLEKHAS